MRLAITSALAFIVASAGLATYELVVLAVACFGLVVALVALAWLVRVAGAVRVLQERQSERIDGLPPPPEG